MSLLMRWSAAFLSIFFVLSAVGSLAAQSLLTITTTSLPTGTQNASYSATLQASGGTPPYTWSTTGQNIGSSGLPAGLSLNSSTGVISGTPTSTGTSSFTAHVKDSKSLTAQKALSINIYAPLTITTASLPAGTQNVGYSATLTASGGSGSFSWSVIAGGLPNGLSLNSNTGVISGTPTSSGTSNFTVQVMDTVTNNTASQALSITIYTSSLTITTVSLPQGVQNVPYNDSLSASGGVPPYSWSITSGLLPNGISFDTNSATIWGVPTQIGTMTITFKATDSQNNSATASFGLTINRNPISITTTALPEGTESTPYTAALTATGGTQPYIWSIIEGALPSGLSLNSGSGTISGTPTTTGVSNFLIQVTDAASNSCVTPLGISIFPAGSNASFLLWSMPNPSQTFTTTTFAAQVNGSNGSLATGTISFQDSGIQFGSNDLLPATNTNYLLYSSAFNNTAVWTANDVTLTPNYSTSPIGDHTAYRLQSSGYSPYFIALQQNVSGLPANQPVTFSIWIESNTGATQDIHIFIDGGTNTVEVPCIVTAGWHRFAVTLPGGSTSVDVGLDSGLQSPTWDVSIWGAQVDEYAPTVGPYLSTTNSPATGIIGMASITTGRLGSGAHSVSASYSGDDNNDPGTSAILSQLLTQLGVTTFNPLVNAALGNPYSTTLSAVGGTSPYVWTSLVGAPPTGLSLASTGTISGSPTNQENAQFVVSVTDSSTPPNVAIQEFEIDVLQGPSCPELKKTRKPDGNCGGSLQGIYPNQVMAGTDNQNITLTACMYAPNNNYGSLSLNLPSGFVLDGQLMINEPENGEIIIQGQINIPLPAQLLNQISIQQNLDGCQASTNMLPYYATTPTPFIDMIEPNAPMIGSDNIELDISGVNFGTNPTVNLPPGITLVGQSSSPTLILVRVNISFQATIGSNTITVTADGQTSNPASFTVNGPIQMVVRPHGDMIGVTSNNQNSFSRYVNYTVQNADLTPAASIAVGENLSWSGWNCMEPDPGHVWSHCDDTHHTATDGWLEDEWSMPTGYMPAGCGFNTTDQWQWCGTQPGEPNPGIIFGTLTGWIHTSSTMINGYTNPPTALPDNYVVKP